MTLNKDDLYTFYLSEVISKTSRTDLKSSLIINSHFFSFDDSASVQSGDFKTVLIME